MKIARYLAMTAEEFSASPNLSNGIAWMSCRFSADGTSLSNLPENLPAGALLVLDDSVSPKNQDPENIAQTIGNIIKKQDLAGLLLDFQRPNSPKLLQITRELIQLDCPVCVAEHYANDLDCPVFLPPIPLTVPIAEYFAPWRNREIWLEIAPSYEEITVNPKGMKIQQILNSLECPFNDQMLHCHYKISKTDDCIKFTLQRTKEDLEDLLEEAASLGITTAVGLYQELK